MSVLVTEHLPLLASAPEGIKKLRGLILELAVRGKLVPQDPNDEPASELLKRIAESQPPSRNKRKIKVHAEILEEDEPFVLPGGWFFGRLEQVGAWAVGSGFPIQEQGISDQAIPFCKVSDMNLLGNERFMFFAKNTISEEVAVRLRVNVHPEGTVIFPKIGGAISTNKRRILVGPTAIDNNCLGITPNGVLSSDYLYLLLSSIDLTRYQAGTSVPALSHSVLGEIVIGIPPLAEQQRIVAKVDELMALCDRLEAQQDDAAAAHAQLVQTLLDSLTQAKDADDFAANWQRLSAHFDVLFTTEGSIDALKQTILQLAVMGKLVPQDPRDEPASDLLKRIAEIKANSAVAGKSKRHQRNVVVSEIKGDFILPAGWAWERFDVIADTRLGKMLDKAKNQGVSKKYLRNTNVQWFNFELDDLKVMRFERRELDEFRVQVGDLLICEGGEPGRCAVWQQKDEEIYFQKALHRARPWLDISPRYLQFYLKAANDSGVLEGLLTGATIKHLPGEKLAKLPVSLPPISEQQRIVAKVDELMSLCDRFKTHLEAARQLHEKLAGALVEQAVA